MVTSQVVVYDIVVYFVLLETIDFPLGIIEEQHDPLCSWSPTTIVIQALQSPMLKCASRKCRDKSA